MPPVNQLHIDAILTNLSIKYQNEAMIWPFVMPSIKVNKRSDKFFKYKKEDSYRVVDDAIGPKAMPNEIDWEVETDNYSVTDHAQADWLPQEVIDNADNPLQPEVDTNEFLNMVMEVSQEKRVADLVFSAATYPSGNKVQLSGTGQWGGSADSPIQDVLTAIETPIMKPNTLIFGQEVWRVFRALPEVLDAVKGATRNQGSPGGLATMTEISSLFEVDRVLVARSKYLSSKEGQTPTFANLWGKHFAALHVVPNPGIRSITFGATFSEMMKQTQRDFDVKRGIKGAHYIKVAWNSDEKIIANDLGYFIEDAVA